MAGKPEVIDLCSDSDADSWDECIKIKSSPEASPVKKSTTATATSTKTNATTTTTSTKSTLVVTKTAIIPPAPIFARQHAAPPRPKKKAKTKATDDMLVAPRSKTTTIKTEQPDTYATSDSSLLSKLNPAQRRAVTSDANTVAILAGPGSGKTHTLTSRVAWLIDQVGYTPSNVIVATFTVKAAREMKERIGKVLGGGREKRIVLGTFHSVSLRYLSAYGTRIGLPKGFSIVDDNDSKSIIKRIVKRLNLELDTAMARGWISKKKSKGCLGTDEENKAKKAGHKESAENKDFLAKLQKIYDEYQSHLQSLNLLDYDDLLIRCTELLRAHPACVANVQAVLIDEYQDTNGIQFELMKLFAQACKRITVVGDPDQSIYGWRSAEITNLTRFLSDFPRTAEIALEENYRSSQCILSTSLQVIQQDQERYDKSLLPVHKKGTLPVLRRLQDSMHEAMWIIQEIRRATLLTGNMLNHGDIAILVRSAALSRPIEQALARAAIPYRMIGGRKFFERAEVKLLVDYLRVIHQPHNNEVLARIINVPRRGVGPKTIKGCLEEAETGNMSMWTLITKHCRGDIIAKTGINATTTKKISRFIDLVQRMQSRLRGALEELGEDDGEDGDGGDDEEDEDGDGEDKKPKAPKQKRDASISTATTAGIITDAFTTTEPGKAYDLVQLITALTEQLNYRNYIGETYGGDEEARWANIDEFVTLAREFMNNAKSLMVEDELPTLDGVEQTKETDVLNKFLANISLAADADKKQEGTDEPLPMVTISTIHAAKGLEWPVVFIPAAYEGSLPHSRSDDTNEERRLLYVAMTRAKCLLNISYSLFGSPDRDREREGRRSEQSLSPFLADIVDVWFAECGPAYDRALLHEMGDILGRDVPKERAIYQNLPTGVPIEDNVLPIDPLESSRYHNEDEDGGYEYSSRFKRQGSGVGSGNNAQQNSKRRRMMNEMPNYSGGGDSQGPWQRGYTTTMEAGFTMGGGTAYPGFTTASAHQTAMLEAEAAEAAKGPPPVISTATTAGDNKRKHGALPTGQQTFMQSFIRSNSTGTTAEVEKAAARSAPPPTKPTFQRSSSMFAMQHQQQAPAAPSGIPAELKSRSLGGVRGNLLPAAGVRNSMTGHPDKKKRYAHFSSSPPPAEEPKIVAEETSEPITRPQIDPRHGLPPPQPKQQQPQPLPYNYNHPRPYRAPQRPVAGKENLQHRVGMQANSLGVGMGGARPAASFHTTTYAQVQAHGSVSTNIRPAGGGGGGPSLAPMDRLRRPFKPPTIRRPQ
ncbi:ATP-dependent DNA helicase srs2 [Sporothrix stenoceras]|uniref:DNA 3'-5' helicase n=1 Tax=Sporothrix stenoceras TaxID=5173 RepID=A0ABR3YMM5_9PEZI